MFVDVLQFLELFLQIFEGKRFLQEGALQFLVLAHDFGQLDLHLLSHLVRLKSHNDLEL